jgi:phosphatidylglycerophosphate synthase
VRTLRTGPSTGLVGQVALYAVLALTVGLSAAGWLLGLAYALVVCVTLTAALHRVGATRLGAADRVTLFRGTLAGGVAALALSHPPLALLLTLASVSLALDLVDGEVARRTGTASALGARFDVEVDAFLLLVLSGYAAHLVGSWVVAIGGLRYLWVAATALLPWLRGHLAPRRWRKVVAAAQGVVLLVAVADLLPRPLTAAALAGSLTLLAASFASCVQLLWRARPAAACPVPAHAVPAPRRATAPQLSRLG